MPENLTDRSVQFGKWRWDLKFSHSALQRIQMTCGSLQGLATQVMGQMKPGAVIPEGTAALLIWAGEAWREPTLTLAKVKNRLAAMNDNERTLLATWAAADFLTAVLQLVEAQMAAKIPEADDD